MSVFHIRIPVKAGGHIWNTEKRRYIWEDKAGGYGIQTEFGRRAIKRIDGNVDNVMGLPLGLLCKMLREFGFDVSEPVGVNYGNFKR